MPMVELSEDEFVEIYRIRQLLEPEEGSLSRWKSGTGVQPC